MISEIELLQKWLVNHNNREISVSATSRYGMLIQVREGFINKCGKDIYDEVITGKMVNVIKPKVLSYDYEHETIEIQEHLDNVETDINNQGIHNWMGIVDSILGTYWDYAYVKELVIGLYG